MSPAQSVTYRVIPCSKIIPSRKNPRSPSPDDEAFIEELAESLRESGMPTIDVQPYELLEGEQARVELPEVEILAGETRWRAWMRAGGAEIGCVIRTGLLPSQITALQVTENVKRRGLSLRDQHFAVTRLYAELAKEAPVPGEGETIQQRAAARLKMDLAWVSLRANIAQLRPEVQQLMLDQVVNDPETLHLLDKVGELDPLIYESELADIRDPDCLEPVTRDSLRNLVRELKERNKRLTETKPAAAPKPQTGELELTEPEESLAPDMPLTIKHLVDDKLVSIETANLLKQLKDVDAMGYHYGSQVSLLRRSVRTDGDQYREGLRLLIRNLESSTARGGTGQPSPAPAIPAKAASAPVETAEDKRRKKAQRIKGEVDDFVRDMNQRLAQAFRLPYEPSQIFANPLSISSALQISEHTPSVPDTPLENKYVIRFAGTLAELEPALGVLLPVDKVRLNTTLECTPEQLRKVEKVLGRPLQFEFRGEGSGKLLQQALKAYEKGAKDKAPKASKTDAPAPGAPSIGAFFKACTQAKKGERVESSDLVRAYEAYCARHGIQPVSAISSVWAGEIERAKLGRVKSNGKRYYTGLQLLVDGE